MLYLDFLNLQVVLYLDCEFRISCPILHFASKFSREGEHLKVGYFWLNLNPWCLSCFLKSPRCYSRVKARLRSHPVSGDQHDRDLVIIFHIDISGEAIISK